MKCAKCGAEIKAGKVYCYKCGAEVQIVSADHVMEEELFWDLQQQELQETRRAAISVEESREVPDKGQRQQLQIAWFAAIAGFLLMTVTAVLLGAAAMRKEAAVSGNVYEQMLVSLAASDETAALETVRAQTAQSESELSARFLLAWLYGAQGDVERQAQTLQEILALDQTNAYACQQLLRIYAKMGAFEKLHEFYNASVGTELEAFFQQYLIEPPTIEVPREVLWEGDMLTITAGEGLNVYYTLDASSPITGGTLYYAPFPLEEGSYTVAAVACNEAGYYSEIVTREVTVERHYPLGMPQVSPKSGEYLSPQTIYITVPQGCSAYYTWNGKTPTAASRKYSGGIAMPEGNNVLSVILVDAYGNVSSVQRMNYIYMP